MHINYFYTTQWNKKKYNNLHTTKNKLQNNSIKNLRNGLNKSYFMTYQVTHMTLVKFCDTIESKKI